MKKIVVCLVIIALALSACDLIASPPASTQEASETPSPQRNDLSRLLPSPLPPRIRCSRPCRSWSPLNTGQS